MGIQVRLIKEEERVLANSFFNRIYKSDRSTEAFNWEFVDGPFGKAIYVIAVDDSHNNETKIVGIQCAIPIELIKASGEIVLTAKSEDTLVDPAYRGQKIFEKMYDVLFEESRKAGIHYIWGFTPADKAFARIGFDIPFKTQQALAVLNPSAAYQHLTSLNPRNTFKQKIQILGLSVLSWLKANLKGWYHSTDYQITEGDLSNPDINHKSFFAPTDLYNLHGTDRFIKWRLLTNPYMNSYVNYIVHYKNAVAGTILCNVRKDVSYIEMILVKDQRILPVALKMVLRKIKERDANVVRVLCFNTNEILTQQMEALDKAGFVTLNRGNYFVWKNLTSANTIQYQDIFLNRLFTQGNL
jgi:GNAT superfamily N-acetyltransferase